MKKSSLLLALPALALSGLLLSGCGIFRSHKAWDTARQESPLEIPPGLDRPSVSDALVIPPPGSGQPAANGASTGMAAPGNQVADGFVLADGVDSAYRRVGQVLENGSLGQVVSHDDAAHSYTLNVVAIATARKGGFFSRLFGRHKGGADMAPGAAAHQVQVTIAGNGDKGSEVRAVGNAGAVAKVVDALKSRLGS